LQLAQSNEVHTFDMYFFTGCTFCGARVKWDSYHYYCTEHPKPPCECWEEWFQEELDWFYAIYTSYYNPIKLVTWMEGATDMLPPEPRPEKLD